MYAESTFRHVALGIDVALEDFSAGHMIDQFDAADLDDAIAAQRVKAGGFGIQNDFPHDAMSLLQLAWAGQHNGQWVPRRVDKISAMRRTSCSESRLFNPVWMT